MSDNGSKNLNSKYAWRELVHQDLPKRSASERAADFLEIYGQYDEASAREQASRCIQCPNPTCVAGCPLCNPIPQWMLLTAEGRFLEAAALLGSATNMAEICARVCPSDHFCEGACLLEAISEPVAIQSLEQFLIDYAFAHGQIDAATAPPNGFKVAVVGSGAGGLACAEELAKKGYAVTIFDSALVPGGLLVDGVPAFKLDQSLVQRRIDLLQKRGVLFRLGVRLWEELTLGQLTADFDAVFLGWDSRRARALEIPGAHLKGVVQAVPFLLQKNSPLQLDLHPIDLAGKTVVVIGGGDTAMDCLRAAVRYGAREAIGVYRREEADMACSRREYQNAVDEGARFQWCAAPVAVLGAQTGNVRGLRMIRTEVDPAGKSRPRPYRTVPGTESEIVADLVIAALGFDPLACPRTQDFEKLAVNEQGMLLVDQNQRTSVPGVFAGGELTRGPTHILHAVRDARRGAEQIHALLSRPPAKVT